MFLLSYMLLLGVSLTGLLADDGFLGSLKSLLSDDEDPHRIEKDTQYRLCSASYVLKSAKHFAAKLKDSDSTVEDEIITLNKALGKQKSALPVFTTETDIRRPEWLNFFILHCGYTYCDTKEKASRMAQPIEGLVTPLPTGRFTITDWFEHHGYEGPKRIDMSSTMDGLYTTAINTKQKLITLSWKGSDSVNDYAADVDAELIGFAEPLTDLFDDRDGMNPQCRNLKDSPDNFFFGGFLRTVREGILQKMVKSLKKARASHPDFSIVINGHSLGGAKALLSATFLSKFYSSKLPLAAVYTFGQPIVGSASVSEWMAKCIGPKKIVRVVTYNDLVPWGRMSPNVDHPQSVIEVYNANPFTSKYRRCQGSRDPSCSYGISCARRSWSYHSQLSGFRMAKKFCQILTPDVTTD